jgi:Leucine Rich Repeat
MMKLSLQSSLIVLTVVIIVVSGASQVSAAIPTAERNALIDLYNSTGGVNWVYTANWLGAPGTECTWERVYCNFEETTVTDIRLYDGYLVGALPDSLADLTGLVVLDLSGNYFSGSIPASWGGFSSLTQLILDDSELSGSIPPELGNISTLQWLDLNDNDLMGSIPASLSLPPLLRFINLSVNDLTGSIPASLGSLAGLQSLFLQRNQLNGPIPAELGDLSNLQYLWMISNKFVGEVPANLMNFNGVGHIDYNGIYTSDPDMIAFLNLSFGAAWAASQTVAPENPVVTGVSDHSVWLSWGPASYGEPGGYNRIFLWVG